MSNDNPEKNESPSHADILAFLERVENDHPELAAAALIQEVDSLLGRDSSSTGSARPREAQERRSEVRDHLVALDASRRSRAKDVSTFAWFQQIATALPPVMSAERTTAAALAVEVGLLAQERLGSLDYQSVSSAYMRDLCMLIIEGRQAFHALVVSNLRLVFHWSKGVASSLGADWAQDAFQSGCIGLIRGVQGWDYKKGYTLSTYVSWHIRQQIQRWRWNEVSLIRVPIHVWERLESGSAELSTSIEAAALRALNIISLDDVDAEDLDLAWNGGFDEIVQQAEIKRTVALLFESLTEREKNVLKFRYGFGDVADAPMTLDNIGKKYGLTRERIRQIETKAIGKIREGDLRTSLIDLL